MAVGPTEILTSLQQTTQALNAILVQLKTMAFMATGGGVTDGSNAAPGNVGEFLTITGANVGLSNANPTNLTSLSLSPGDWQVWGNATFSSSVAQLIATGLNTVSGTLPTALINLFYINLNTGAIAAGTFPVPQQRYSITTTTTIYLNAQVNFTTGPTSATGNIFARRMR